MYVTSEKVALLRKRHVGKTIRLGVFTYRISGFNRDVYDNSKIEVNLETLNDAGVVVSRTTSVMTIEILYGAIQR